MQRLSRIGLIAALGVMSVTAAVIAIARHGDQLRHIVQQQCLPHWLSTHDPSPCLTLTLITPDPPRGFVLYPDQKGGAHFLLLPIETLRGIEDPGVRAAHAINYFAAAWNQRDVLATVLKRAPARTAIGLAVNAVSTRSQNQLHIHIECLRTPIYQALLRLAPQLREEWTSDDLAGRRYQVRRLLGDTLAANPFVLLAEGVRGAGANMASYTLVVAGAQFHDGPGFVLLAAQGAPGGESLLDPSCALMRR